MLANVTMDLESLPVRAAPVLIDAFVKGALLLGVSALVAFALRRSSAAVRHLVWTIGLSSVLLMPVLSSMLPHWRVPVPLPGIARSMPAPGGINVLISPGSAVDAQQIVAVFDAMPAPVPVPPALAAPPAPPAPPTPVAVIAIPASSAHAGTPSPVVVTVPVGPGPARATPVPTIVSPVDEAFSFNVSTSPAPANWQLVLFVVWLTGAVLQFGSLLFSVLRVRALHFGTQLVEDGPCVDAVWRAARMIGLRRVPEVRIGSERMMPMVWGLFHPVLLLPAGAARWPAARLEAVLLHELAHVRRYDALTQLIAEITRVVFWFNPLVWFAARQIYLERELACDDMVLNAGTRPSDYAGDLLDLVRSLRASRATGLAAIAMARPSQIKVRLRAVLDEARSRGTPGRRMIVAASVLALGLMMPLAAARPRAVEARIPTLDGALDRILSVPTPRPLKAARARRHPGARWLPTADIAPAPAAVASTPAVAAALAQDQQETCWDPNARNKGTSINNHSDGEVTTVKWVSGRCSGHVRMEGKVKLSGDLTGIQSISPGGIFQIDEDDGSIDRRLTIRPNGARLEYDYRVDGRRVEFDAAGEEWLSHALLALYRSTGFAADERVDYLLRTKGASAVIDEVDVMPSDYTQRIYLQKLLQRTNLSPELVQDAIEVAAREIGSDYELAELLIAFAGKYDFNDRTRKLFIDATRTIESDYEQRRVLATALAKGDLDSADVTSMLKASTNISSDYERAELLIGLTQKYKMDSAMRSAYLTSANDIQSDYEKRRVYENLLKQGAMTPADLASVLAYAGSIGSDYEKAEVLIGLSKYDLSDAALQRAYVTAASHIGSDYEHRRALTSILQKDKMAPGNLDIVLKSAADISSDYELSELLLLVASKNDLNEPQRQAFMKALNSIGSSYEYGRVASALLRKSN